MNPVFAFGMEGDEPGLESILKSTLKQEVKLPLTRQQAISGLIKEESNPEARRKYLEKREIAGMILGIVRIGKLQRDYHAFGLHHLTKADIIEGGNAPQGPDWLDVQNKAVLDFVISRGIKRGYVAFYDGREWVTGDESGYKDVVYPKVGLMLTGKGIKLYNSTTDRGAYFS